MVWAALIDMAETGALSQPDKNRKRKTRIKKNQIVDSYCRPLAVMGGLCLAGLQMMNEVRRTAEDQTTTVVDFARDQMFDDLNRAGVGQDRRGS